MKTQNSANTPQPAKKIRPLRIAAIAIGALLVLVVAVVYGFSMFVSGNYAKDTAKPMEQALVSNGAVKKCEAGDGGRSLDNRKPWYKAYFEVPTGKEQAITAVDKIATDNGYKLEHASPSNRGPLDAVADIYIDAWYFDNTSKANPYADLQGGKVELAMTVNASGADKACGSKAPIAVDAGHSVVSLEVGLPSFK